MYAIVICFRIALFLSLTGVQLFDVIRQLLSFGDLCRGCFV